MNQILYTGDKKNGPASIKSILKFFGIALIIIGIIFICNGSYALYQNNRLSKEEVDNTIPEIAFEQEGNNAVITITHNKGISKVKYHWNDNVDTIIQGNSESTVILDNISIIPGTNTLYVSAIDINGKSNENSFDYSYDGIAIEFSVVDNTYIKITASDITGLYYIKYKWNSEEEITAYPSNDDLTIIEQMIEIPSGLNTLHVTAVNSANKTLERYQDFKGNYPPKIQVYLQGNDLIVNISDDEGIAKIIQQINIDDEQVIYDGSANIEPKTTYSYRYEINDEDNILVKITATDVEGFARTYRGKNY